MSCIFNRSSTFSLILWLNITLNFWQHVTNLYMTNMWLCETNPVSPIRWVLRAFVKSWPCKYGIKKQTNKTQTQTLCEFIHFFRWGMIQFKKTFNDETLTYNVWHVYKPLFDVYNALTLSVPNSQHLTSITSSYRRWLMTLCVPNKKERYLTLCWNTHHLLPTKRI